MESLPLTILVVERSGVRTGIREALVHDKHDVHVAADALTARAMARIHAFDAVILEAATRDEGMLARELRKERLPPSSVIIAVANDALICDDLDREPSLDMCLRLPIDTELLSGLVHYLRSMRAALTRGERQPRSSPER